MNIYDWSAKLYRCRCNNLWTVTLAGCPPVCPVQLTDCHLLLMPNWVTWGISHPHPFTLYSTLYWSSMLYTATATLIACNLRQSPSILCSIQLYPTLRACSRAACGFPCHYQSLAVYLTVHAVTRTVLLMFHKILDGNDETLRFCLQNLWSLIFLMAALCVLVGYHVQLIETFKGELTGNGYPL